MTAADFQKYSRIILYMLAGALIQHGYGSQATWEPWIGFAMTLLNLGWTLYGSRVQAKIDALVATGEVAHVVVKDQALADAIPSPIVTSTAETVVKPK